VAGIIIADTIQSGGDLIRLNSASQTVATINAKGIYANTGNLLIAANGTIGAASITNTAITGTITQAQIGNAVAGTGPAFSVLRSSSTQSISQNVWTKVQLQSEEFDTASCYDNSTNYRFTPNVAGYYQVDGTLEFNNLSGSYRIAIYKNGSAHRVRINDGNSNGATITISSLIYLNGTTDYIELYGYTSITSQAIYNGSVTSFHAYLARAA
jgi:hypothetical protein